MRIYIPNVKLPLIGKLRITAYPNGREYISTDDGVICITPSATVGAIEVLPHGRLIDADALCEGLVSNHPVVIHVKNADTIIPADPEKEDT